MTSRSPANCYDVRDPISCLAFNKELSAFFSSKLERSASSGQFSYANISVETSLRGIIEIFSGHALRSHFPPSLISLSDGDVLIIDVAPFPQRRLFSGFARLIQNRRLALLGKELFFEREWKLLEKRISAQDALLRERLGLQPSPMATAASEQAELSAMIPIPSAPAAKPRRSL